MRAALLFLLVGCDEGMGETCESSRTCANPGICLAGVCSGYPCDSDEECENDLQCSTIDGVTGCFLACEESADCAGDQQCREVATASDDESAKARYCL